MKKFTLLATMVAMVLVVTVPALAIGFLPGIEIGTQDNNAAVDLTDAECIGIIIQQQNQAGLLAIQDQDEEAIQRICQEIVNNNNTTNNNTVTGGDQEFEQDAETGDIDSPIDVAVEGDNNNACLALQPTNSTAVTQDEVGLGQLGSELGEAEFAGDESAMSPELLADCTPTIAQEANAS